MLSKYQDGSNIVLVTEQAALVDAFESLSVNVTKQLSPADVKSILDIPGVRLLQAPANLPTSDFQFEMTNAVLYDQDGELSTIGDQIVVNGLLSVQPQIHLRIKIENGALEEFFFTSSMSVQNGFTVSSKISLSVPLYEHSFLPQPIPLGAFPVGPIIVTPELDLIAGITGAVYAGVFRHRSILHPHLPWALNF